ncbi:MAG: hypothetical protein K2K16_01275 [Ruminococcus sp.]|nr:hypothetical protein [Ruminococcus sp.]
MWDFLKFIKVVLIVIISVLAYVLLWTFFPIVLSNKSVRNYVIREISIGTSWEDATKIINENKWVIKIVDIEHGLEINDSAESVDFASTDEMSNGSKYASSRIVGKKAMFVELGEFYSPFHTAVFAYLAFDENDSLMEVAIRRDIDGI